MRPRLISMVMLFAACIFLSLVCTAETLTLSSGKTFQGKIVEETDTYIALEQEGVTIKYSKDDIVRINRKPTSLEPVVPVVKRVANASSSDELIKITLKEDPNKDLPRFVKKLDDLKQEIGGIAESAKGKLSALGGEALTADHRAIMEEALDAMQQKVALLRHLTVPPAARELRNVAIKIVDLQARYFSAPADTFKTVEQLKEYWTNKVDKDMGELDTKYQDSYTRLQNPGNPAAK